MREWLQKIFKKEEGIDEREMEAFYREQRILDIKRRIEEQRAQLAHNKTRSITTRSYEQIPQETPRVDQAREAKNAELADLKAKLLGKRK